MQLPEPTEGPRTPYDGRLAAGETYDAVELRGIDQPGAVAPDAVLLECLVSGGHWDDAVLTGARLADCLFQNVAATALMVAHAQFRDVLLRSCRWGVLDARSASWTRVGVVDGRWDYVNLRGAELEEVRFEGVHLGDLDLGGATVRRLTLVDVTVERLDLHEARLSDVDLTGATLRRLDGLTGLAGATISPEQCLDLAGSFAAQLGVRVLGSAQEAEG
ncbi:MAG: pentapeptide repeat-containing protein [Austwickia sp.]|nr:MAG: pentapeptide repeat-containing protein [Austwickia sp.]